MRKFTKFLALASLLFLTLQGSALKAQTLFFENFGNGMPSGFTLYNVDNRTPATSVSYVNAAWIVREDFVVTPNDSCAFSTSWYTPAGAADDWMITPAITLPSTGSFTVAWEALSPDPSYRDGYEVRVATSNTLNAIQNGTQIYSNSQENTTWTSRSISLTPFLGQTIYIGFHNNSNDKFLLMIDSITVASQIQYDGKLDNVSRLSEYGQIPISQVFPLSFSADISNQGSSAVTNVRFNIDVKNSQGTSVYSASSTPTASLASGGTATKTVPSWTPNAVEDYDVYYYVSIQENDGNTSNDTIVQSISITDSTFARDNNVLNGSLGIGGGATGILGQVYELTNAGDLTSVSFYIGNGNDQLDGQDIWVEVLAFNGQPGATIATTDTVTWDTTSGVLVTLPISGGPVSLPADTFYLGVIEGDSNVSLGYSNQHFTPNTTFLNFPGNPFNGWASNEAYNFQVSYILRANLAPVCPAFSFNNSVNDASCGNNDGSATVNVSGASGSLSYLWSNGDTTQTSNNLGAGTYTVIVTDSVGCADTTSIAVSNVGGPTLDSLTSTNIFCNGDANGTAAVFASGGTPSYTYTWSNGDTSQVIGGLSGGTYSVTVTDANGCILSAGSVTVTEPAAVSASISSLDESAPGASDGQAIAVASGGTSPYTYSWSNGANTASIGGLTAGTYTITITDANGCTLIDSAIVGVTTSVGGSISNDALVDIFPNPSNGNFNLQVEMPKVGDISIEIIDITGQKVYARKIEQTSLFTEEINLKGQLTSGSYLMRVQAGNVLKLRKLVIE